MNLNNSIKNKNNESTSHTLLFVITEVKIMLYKQRTSYALTIKLIY